MTKRTYYDPLHQSITLDDQLIEEEMVIKLIDSAPFQRLRRIKQLGPASLTFHGAESSRFTHSLGVFHIARRAFNKLITESSKLNKFRSLLYAASLLHDIGHGPLSHTSEEMFGINHEYWSSRIIREDKEISSILNTTDPSLSNKVANIISGKKVNEKLIKSLVSSQLDCDRLDYLMRDSHNIGINYGQIDLERILSALILAPDDDIAVNPKGLLAVEHYLVVRNLMYRSIYNHRLNEVCNWLLEKIIETAKKIGPKSIWADECLSKWLWDMSKMDIKYFLANDDIRTMYHIIRWKEDSPRPLKELCENFINRKLLKAINIEFLPMNLQLEALAITRKLSEKNGKDPEFNCGLRHNKFISYQPYKSGLRMWDGQQLQSIENKSILIERLISPSKTAWLIFPKEINYEINNEIIKLQSSY